MVRPHKAPNGPHSGRLIGAGEPFEMPSYRPEPWMENGACNPNKYPSARALPNEVRQPLDMDDWFKQPNSTRTRLARSVCNEQCPVRAECAAYALRKRITEGIWGGLTEKQLREAVNGVSPGRKAKSFVVIRGRRKKAS